MPPKAKGKAKALPKAKGKAKARPRPKVRPGVPAARGRLVPRRRPAVREEVEESVEFKFNAGEEVTCEDVGPFAWAPDLWVAFTGQYWGAACKVAGQVKSYRREGALQELSLKPTGTNHEKLQNWGASNLRSLIRVHLCSRLCGGEKMEDDYFHAHQAVKITGGLEEPWMRSLEIVVDDIPELRRVVEGDVGKGASPPREDRKESPVKKEKKKKKKKKKEKKKEEKEEGKKEARGKKEKKKCEGKEESSSRTSSTSTSSGSAVKKNPGKKSLASVFGRTGLDPSPKRRLKLRKRVRKSLKKAKKKKGSSDSNSVESSSSLESTSHLFQENKKVKVIHNKMPGALTAQSVEEMQESLLTSSGQVWNNAQEGSVPHFRTVLQPRMSGGLAREALTLSMLIDMALQGRIAESLDIGIQRLKALELIARGSDYRVAQRLELCPLELDAMASASERREAIQESREEAKLRFQSQKGGDYWKGDWKGSSKDSWGKKGDGKKGTKKGGEKGDDRGKNSGDPEKKK